MNKNYNPSVDEVKQLSTTILKQIIEVTKKCNKQQ